MRSQPWRQASRPARNDLSGRPGGLPPRCPTRYPGPRGVPMFGGRYSFDRLATWCRMVRHGHGAGLTLVRVFDLQARNGPAELRPAAARIARALEAGDSLEDALAAEAPVLPEMFVSLAGVGERTGRMPEV